MSNCLECDKRTSNPKFCSLSCSAKFQPHIKKVIAPRQCMQCNEEFTVKKASDPNKFCSNSCSARYNNQHRTTKRDPISSKLCPSCGEEIIGRANKFCSSDCSNQYRSEKRIEDWLSTGILKSKSIGNRDKIREYILDDQGGTCSICPQKPTWQGKNLVFVLDHVDGNSEDNRRVNLRLVCPNCNSQLDTFTSKNKGQGRHWRRARYAAGKSF